MSIPVHKARIQFITVVSQALEALGGGTARPWAAPLTVRVLACLAAASGAERKPVLALFAAALGVAGQAAIGVLVSLAAHGGKVKGQERAGEKRV